jgi:hypothetical protein
MAAKKGLTFADRTKARLEDYKREVLGVSEDGVWDGREYSHILPPEQLRLNVLESYRDSFWNYYDECAKDPRTRIGLHQRFAHLNSSQALCFNLFYPLLAEDRLELLLELLSIRAGRVRESRFEKALDRTEGTKIDFYLALDAGRRVVFEVKYAEVEFGPAKDDTGHRDKFRDIYLPNLRGKVKPEYLEFNAAFRKHYQVLRNLYQVDVGRGDAVVFLYPKANEALMAHADHFIDRAPTDAYKKCVRKVYLEELLEKQYLGFREKYLPYVLTQNEPLQSALRSK